MAHNAKCGDKRHKRYDPLLVKWACRMIIQIGESRYEELRGVLELPCPRYLRDYKNAVECEDGTQHALLREWSRRLASEREKGPLLCVTAHDAMKCSKTRAGLTLFRTRRIRASEACAVLSGRSNFMGASALTLGGC